MKQWSILILAFMLIANVPNVNAVMQYDYNVTPDVIFGTGNGNGYWTADVSNGIELGLRGKLRWQGIYNSNGAGTYSFAPGVSSGSAALWNYEFAINVENTGNTLSSYNIVLGIDVDPGLGQNWLYGNPFLYWTDNALGYNSTPNGGGVIDPANYGLYTVAQNSQNLGWAPIAFDPYAAATYDFTLFATDLSGNKLAQTYMTVEVDGGAPIPEPGTVLLLGAGLLGLFGINYKRRRSMK